MAMSIEPQFNIDDVRKRCNMFLEAVEDAQITRLQRLGEMCVNEARNNKGYMMQTGALMSSTGYMIFQDGVAIHDNFVQTGVDSSAMAKGEKKGRALAQAKGEMTKGIALVCVAGMNYAVYVESHGYNVLKSAETLAERELPKMLSQLISNIKKDAK